MTIITFVDLETTGLKPDHHEIIELAALRTEIKDNQLSILDSVNFKVQPAYPVDPFIAKMNGYNFHLWEKEAVSLEVAIGSVFTLMRDAWHAGSNPKFDESFLKVAARDFNWDYPKTASYHLIDVSVLAFPLLIQGKVEKIKQESIAKYYGIEGGGHRALSDTMQCMKIFAKINSLEIKE
jgi:DNA polymerase-3 subunit epsilon